MKICLKKSVMLCALFALAATAGSGMCFAEEQEVTSGSIKLTGQKESEFPELAAITLFQAVTAARAEVSGKLLKAELENENGFLVYVVEIVTADKSVNEVMVDAGNGTVLLAEKDREDSCKSRGNNSDQDDDDDDDDDDD